jgi:hypothetical protein
MIEFFSKINSFLQIWNYYIFMIYYDIVIWGLKFIQIVTSDGF